MLQELDHYDESLQQYGLTAFYDSDFEGSMASDGMCVRPIFQILSSSSGYYQPMTHKSACEVCWLEAGCFNDHDPPHGWGTHDHKYKPLEVIDYI